MTNTSQQFNGFTLPDGAWLPPELLYLLPLLSSAQLKITIAVIYHYAQVGGREPLTLNDIQSLSGIKGRSTLTGALAWLLGENEAGLQVLEREPVDRTYTYRPRIQLSPLLGLSEKEESSFRTLEPEKSPKIVPSIQDESPKIVPSAGESVRESERELIKDFKSFNSLSDSSSLTAAESPEIRLTLLKELRAVGVYLKTGQGLVENYTEEHIRQKMAYFVYAKKAGFANKPGWLVLAIKENWPPPLGYTTQPQSLVPEICPRCFSHPCRCEIREELDDDFETPRFDGSAKALKAWQSAQAQLRAEMPPAAFETWVAPAWLADFDADAVEFAVASRSADARDWLESRLASDLTRRLTGLMAATARVQFVVLE